MESNIIDYKRLVDETMHIIVYKVLSQVEKYGLPGNHHFYISFLTKAPDVKLSKYLLSSFGVSIRVKTLNRSLKS